MFITGKTKKKVTAKQKNSNLVIYFFKFFGAADSSILTNQYVAMTPFP